MNYMEIATFPSSKGDKTYTVKMNNKGELSCDCPSWIYNQRGNRSCKHTDQVGTVTAVPRPEELPSVRRKTWQLNKVSAREKEIQDILKKLERR